MNQSIIIGVEPDNGVMKVVPGALDIPCEGLSVRVAVRTADSNSSAWSVSGNQSWIILSTNGGAGSGAVSNVIVTAQPNYSNMPRKAMLTFIQGKDTFNLPILQMSEGGTASGHYGNELYTYYSAKDSGDYVVFRPEVYGQFVEGDTLVGVYFQNYYSSQAPTHTCMNYVIKVYENPTYSIDLAEGSTEYFPSSVLGTLVHAQSYTATAYGLQEVKLTTPYVRTKKPFWVMLECKGKSLLLLEQVFYPDTLYPYMFPYQNAIKGAYLVGTSSEIRADYNAVYTDNTYSKILQYNLDYAFGVNMSVTLPPLTYEIDAKADDISHGYVSGAGKYYKGDTVRLAAVANIGYSFVRWQDGDTAENRTFEIGNYSYPEYIAYFQSRQRHSLVLLSNNLTMGSVVGNGLYYEGDTAVAVAVPFPNHQFVKWSDAVTDNPRHIVMDQNVALGAIFIALDTAYVHDTTIIYDTVFVNRYVHDTTILHDTTRIYVHDTTILHDTLYLYRYVHDTTLIHDTTTLYYYVHDTTTLHDTSYIYRYVHDTTLLVDTVNINHYIHDTTIVNYYIHDTTKVFDTLYVNHYDTVWKDLPKYVYDIRSDNEQQGTTVGSGTYPENLMVGVAALPKENYRFVKWSDGSTENPRHILVSGKVELTAYFEPLNGTPDMQDASLNVYPNPTSDRIIFSMEAEKADVWDENGKCVMAAENVSGLDLSELANGVYTLRVVTMRGVSIKKIVKR